MEGSLNKDEKTVNFLKENILKEFEIEQEIEM